jgi:hypothetical protein
MDEPTNAEDANREKALKYAAFLLAPSALWRFVSLRWRLLDEN